MCADMPTSSRKISFNRISCSWALSSASLFQSMAAKPGRNSKAVVFQRWPCAILRSSRARMISSSGRTAAASGSSTTSRRCARSPLICFKQEASFVSARPVQQRIEANGGWANGAATFVGDNPPEAAVITYYQRSRHLFGKLKIEVLDPSGRVVDEVPASKRPGIESRHLEYARKAAARSASGADRRCRDPRSAFAPGRLHRAHDEDRKGDRDETHGRP